MCDSVKINYCPSIRIKVHPLLSVYQLWAVLNKTIHYSILVSQKIPKIFRERDQSMSLLLINKPHRANVEEIMNF